MKKMSSICFIFLLTLFMLNSQSPAETTLININFENMAPGVKPTNFLADYGITDMVIGGTGSTAGPPAIIDLSPYPNHHAPSPYNVFRQHLYCGGSYPPYPACNQSGGPTHSLTMFFTPELVSFGLSRLGTSGGASTSIWRAYFYNSSKLFLWDQLELVLQH